jgi:hypothetical protein
MPGMHNETAAPTWPTAASERSEDATLRRGNLPNLMSKGLDIRMVTPGLPIVAPEPLPQAVGDVPLARAGKAPGAGRQRRQP